MKAAIHTFDSSTEFYTDERCYVVENANDDNNPDLSVAQIRVTPGITTQWHSLTDTAERYVILSGKGRMEVGDLPPQIVTCGDVVVIPPDVPQRITNIGDEDLLFLALCSPRFEPDCYVNLEEQDGK